MRLRYPNVALPAAHYESVYSMLVHPSEARALWVRTTVQKRAGQRPSGALWVTWFTAQGIRAGKLNDVPVAPGGHGIVVGEASQGTAGSRGGIALPGLSASWEVTFAPRTGSLEHLAPALLYRAPLPRTKATSPVPDLDANGTLTVDGEEMDLSGWTGMLGHNWGTEHAARWIWLRAAGLGANGQAEGDGWLDAILARVRLGPVLAPWTGFGTLFLDGKRHRLGGLSGRGTKVALRSDGANITLAGRGVTVVTRATVAPASTVGWAYCDPSGRRHEVVNSSVATMSLDVVGDGRHLELTPIRRGVLEVGGDERAFDVPLQPVPD